MFRLGVIATGGKRVRQVASVVRKGFWLVGCLGVERRWMRSLCQKPSAILGNYFGWGPVWLGETGRDPFSIIPWHLPYNWGKARQISSHSSRLVRQVGRPFRGSLDWLAERQPSSVTRGWLQSALDWHRCLPSCRTKGFPASGNFESKLSVSALMWSAKNGIPKSSWICLLPTYQGALVAMRRHLDCNTCSLLMWVWATDRQIGHA
jgi:hypothetical protein